MFKNPNPKIQPQKLTSFGKIEQECHNTKYYLFFVIKNCQFGCDTNVIFKNGGFLELFGKNKIEVPLLFSSGCKEPKNFDEIFQLIGNLNWYTSNKMGDFRKLCGHLRRHELY